MLWSFLKCSIFFLCCACLVNVPFLEAAGLGKLSVRSFSSLISSISIKVEHEKIEFTIIKPKCLDGNYGYDKNTVHLNFGNACSMDFSWSLDSFYFGQDQIFHYGSNIAVVIDFKDRIISFNGFKKLRQQSGEEKIPEFPCISKIEGKATAVTARGSARCNIDILFMNPLVSPKSSSKTTSPTLKKAGSVFDLGASGWIGIGVGILVLVVLVAFLIFWFACRRRQGKKQATTAKLPTVAHTPMNTPITCIVGEDKAIDDPKEVTAISQYFDKNKIPDKALNVSKSKSKKDPKSDWGTEVTKEKSRDRRLIETKRNNYSRSSRSDDECT